MISLVDTLARFNFQSANVILDKNSNISNQLWLGDFTAAIDKRWQKENNIIAVLTVAQNLNIVTSDSVQHKVIDARDIETYDISKDFDEGCNFIAQWIEKGNVLVHCAAGVSRSASMVICYLMRTQKWNFSKAYSFVKSKRRQICPNDGFISCLKQEEKLLGLQKTLGGQNINNQFQNQSEQKYQNSIGHFLPRPFKPLSKAGQRSNIILSSNSYKTNQNERKIIDKFELKSSFKEPKAIVNQNQFRIQNLSQQKKLQKLQDKCNTWKINEQNPQNHFINKNTKGYMKESNNQQKDQSNHL